MDGDDKADRPLDRKILGWLLVGLTAMQIAYMVDAMDLDWYEVKAAADRWFAKLHRVDARAEAVKGITEIEQYLYRASRRGPRVES